MTPHPLDACIIDLLEAHRALLGDEHSPGGFSYPGFLRERLNKAFQSLYNYRRSSLSPFKERHATWDALQLMLEASHALDEQKESTFGEKLLAAAQSLHPIAGWPPELGGHVKAVDGVPQ